MGRVEPRQNGWAAYWLPAHVFTFPLFLPGSSHAQCCPMFAPHGSSAFSRRPVLKLSVGFCL